MTKPWSLASRTPVVRIALPSPLRVTGAGVWLRGKYLPHFTDEEVEAQRVQATFPESVNQIHCLTPGWIGLVSGTGARGGVGHQKPQKPKGHKGGVQLLPPNDVIS